jgi:hypothetical protein
LENALKKHTGSDGIIEIARLERMLPKTYPHV